MLGTTTNKIRSKHWPTVIIAATTNDNKNKRYDANPTTISPSDQNPRKKTNQTLLSCETYFVNPCGTNPSVLLTARESKVATARDNFILFLLYYGVCCNFFGMLVSSKIQPKGDRCENDEIFRCSVDGCCWFVLVFGDLAA
jgi:hypothetical protein